MRHFIHEDFLLENEYAHRLYHRYAASMPIIDYHCHLSPQEIAEDKQFRSITELWLAGDHYKWRGMRTNGVDEQYITGNASDWEKFEKWAETVPYTLRNPLYHWTHLELSTAFDIHEVLNPESARRIYERCNELLALPEYSARGLMRKYNVEVVCTTDDPIDSLQYHQQIKESGFEIKVLPAWRPDNAMTPTDPIAYKEYVEKLGKVSGVQIDSYDRLLEALQIRHDYFAEHGCTVADHGVSEFPWKPCGLTLARVLFNKVMGGHYLDHDELMQFQTCMLLELCKMNARKGWVQQFHFGVLRNTNTKMLNSVGINTGFDSIADFQSATALTQFFDTLNSEDLLAKSIVYSLNPNDFDMLATTIGDFQDGKVPGKMQLGSGWWFSDQLLGMERQMNALSVQGLLSRFVGMLTDSRSFVSYPRHEYFRRLLCNIIGKDIERGMIPMEEWDRCVQMVKDISYYNAKNYFNF